MDDPDSALAAGSSRSRRGPALPPEEHSGLHPATVRAIANRQYGENATPRRVEVCCENFEESNEGCSISCAIDSSCKGTDAFETHGSKELWLIKTAVMQPKLRG